MTGDRNISDFRDLVAHIVASSMGGDGISPSLPEGRRAEVAEVLTRCLMDTDALGSYCEILESELRRRGVLTVGSFPVPELPIDEIGEHGLSILTDEQLAALALDSMGLGLLSGHIDELLDCGEGGVWVHHTIAESRRDLAMHGLDHLPAAAAKRLLTEAAQSDADSVAQPNQSEVPVSNTSDDEAPAVAIDAPNTTANVIDIRQTLGVVCDDLLSGDSVNVISARALVDETRRRIHLQDKQTPVPDRQFYEVAASELRRLIVDRAKRAITSDDQRRSKETVSGSAASEMTLPMADRAPKHVLKLDRRLDELSQIDDELVRIFLLSEFAGRSGDEIAALTGSSPSEVTAAVDAAKTELSLID